MSQSRDIVILLYQYSVVVKGIERKLLDLGYRVEILTEEFDKIPGLTDGTDLFLMYLPGDIMDTPIKMKRLQSVCGTIKEHGSKMLILGEKKYHEDLENAVPVIDAYGWLDRPVEGDTLKAAVETAIKGGAVAGVKKKVLIVDDDPSYAGMVRAWIKDSYNVGIVTAGMQAIAFLAKNPVDLILLDYEMPVVDGPQVLQMLRQEESMAHIPVVFLTGVGTKEGVERVMRLRPDGYVLKSTTRENLLAYIHKIIG